jgi:hypothetical protein
MGSSGSKKKKGGSGAQPGAAPKTVVPASLHPFDYLFKLLLIGDAGMLASLGRTQTRTILTSFSSPRRWQDESAPPSNG